MLKTFLPLFMMTFFICLFIVMMQFLWKYIDELVGKGLSVDLIAELFFYAALSMMSINPLKKQKEENKKNATTLSVNIMT